MIEDNRLVREGMFVMPSDLPDVEVVLAVTRLEAGLLRKANPRVVLLQVPRCVSERATRVPAAGVASPPKVVPRRSPIQAMCASNEAHQPHCISPSSVLSRSDDGSPDPGASVTKAYSPRGHCAEGAW